MNDLPNFMAAFDDYQESVVMDQTMFFDLKICVDEAIANIFNHGYKEDNADYFNPYSVDCAPDLTATLEERKIGGLGIHLIKNLSDSLESGSPRLEANPVAPQERYTINFVWLNVIISSYVQDVLYAGFAGAKTGVITALE